QGRFKVVDGSHRRWSAICFSVLPTLYPMGRQAYPCDLRTGDLQQRPFGQIACHVWDRDGARL
ncbi:hypothetical protein, partial [Streptomyces albireticuli]